MALPVFLTIKIDWHTSIPLCALFRLLCAAVATLSGDRPHGPHSESISHLALTAVDVWSHLRRRARLPALPPVRLPLPCADTDVTDWGQSL